MKEVICTALGLIGSAIAAMFGGWNQWLTTLIVFMALDYACGLIVAGVFHNSPKSETGALESKAGWKGLCRKCMTLVYVLIAHRLDVVMGTTYIRDAVSIAYTVNEVISITEKAGLMGVPLPAAIKRAIDILQKRIDKEESED